MMSVATLAGNNPELDNCVFQLDTQRRSWLETLDRDPGRLIQFLSERAGTRLGLYFEWLWHFFLLEDARTALLAHNVAVTDGARTLGEFDCLYYCQQRQRAVHLELAVKFYLARVHRDRQTQPDGLQGWLGPNSRDRLDLKMDHLMQRQTRLGESEAGRLKLAAMQIHRPLREVAVKGYLFKHYREADCPPQGFNPRSRLEPWLHVNELDSFLQHRPEKWFRPLARRRWLGPAQASDSGPSLNANELIVTAQQALDEHPRPLLVAALDSAGNESARFFITGVAWPEKTA